MWDNSCLISNICSIIFKWLGSNIGGWTPAFGIRYNIFVTTGFGGILGGMRMASVEPDDIISVLRDSGGELSMEELVAKVVARLRATHPNTTPTVVKSAVLPLIAGSRVALTEDRKLRLRIPTQRVGT
jgi:hypothetical protein